MKGKPNTYSSVVEMTMTAVPSARCILSRRALTASTPASTAAAACGASSASAIMDEELDDLCAVSSALTWASRWASVASVSSWSTTVHSCPSSATVCRNLTSISALNLLGRARASTSLSRGLARHKLRFDLCPPPFFQKRCLYLRRESGAKHDADGTRATPRPQPSIGADGTRGHAPRPQPSIFPDGTRAHARARRAAAGRAPA